MTDWKYFELHEPMPELCPELSSDGFYGDRLEMEGMVRRQVSDVLAIFGEIEEVSIVNTHKVDIGGEVSYYALESPSITTVDDGEFTVRQMPFSVKGGSSKGVFDTSTGLHVVDLISQDLRVPFMFSVWDPRMIDENAVSDKNGSKLDMPLLVELHLALNVYFGFLVKTCPQNDQLLDPSKFPVRITSPDIEAFEEQFRE
ncbi:MAG: hypothetical protein ACI9T8_000321 [Candidatus Saccharimonadales bacterium]|jgi:hypothetical protein